jgi:hypothetical protein
MRLDADEAGKEVQPVVPQGEHLDVLSDSGVVAPAPSEALDRMYFFF